MNKKIILSISILIVLLVVGFLSWRFWPRREPIVEIASIPDDLAIFLEIRGSYYPVESKLQIKADGSVYYKHGFYISTGSEKPPFEKNGKISEGELKEILKSFYENKFFSLRRSYHNPHITDASTITITITLQGKSYTVEEYGGAGPKSFYKILEKLNSVRDKIIAIPGKLKVTLNGQSFIGETPDKTKENIKNFFQNIDSKIEITNINDPNYHDRIIILVILPKDMSPEEYLIYRGNVLEKDPAVLKVSPILINDRDAWEIKFKQPLYIGEIKQFLDKYPRLKGKLFSPKLNDLHAEISVPEGTEDQYINNLPAQYPEKILKVEKVFPILE